MFFSLNINKNLFLLFVIFSHCILDGSPQHIEQQALETVGDNLGLETSEEQAVHTIFLNHLVESLHVSDGHFTGLLGGLQHANGVGAGIRNSRGAESNQSSNSLG
jgi:hypothetical protein